MAFSEGGRSAGEDDAVFMTMDRNSEVSGSTDSGGVLGILVRGLGVSDGGGDEKEPRDVGSTEAYVAWRSNDFDESFLECVVKKEVLGISFTCLIGAAILSASS
jgi:hypothetical protein